MMIQRLNILSLTIVLLLVLLNIVSTTSAIEDVIEDSNEQNVIETTTTTTSMHRDATDTIPSNGEVPEQRRELFWSLVFIMELLKDPPCPPIGPLHDKCKARKEANNNDSTTSSVTSESTTSYVSDSTNGVMTQTGSSRMKLWMFIVAAAAAATAFAAAVIGQRRQERKPHMLTGSVARRMGLFQNFCDSTLCNDESRHSRVVEMTMSMDDYDAITDDNNRNTATV